MSLRPEDYTTFTASAENVLDQLLQSDRGKLMVVQRQRLVDVISVFDFVDYLRILRQIDSEPSFPE
ncbi:hypothetical protein [Pseudophaeobacter sp.]|uniref:hypothetical protein n=1 Tax=Pseudophaeobacter sp. TaxID=1971739 RepID=UPI003297F54A